VYGLILISLFLNIICFYLIFSLRKKVELNNQDGQSVTVEEVEELLKDFSLELHEENKKLHELLITLKNNETSQLPKLNLNSEHEQHIETKSAEPVEESIEKNETNHVIALAKQGYNSEEIAKMLNRGKGEIELLLKFYA
jgi:transposase